MSGRPAFADTGAMPRYMLEHRHAPRECGVVFASFNAFESPLPPQGGLRHVQLRHAPDLVGAGGGHGSRGSVAVAALRGGADHRHSRSARQMP